MIGDACFRRHFGSAHSASPPAYSQVARALWNSLALHFYASNARDVTAGKMGRNSSKSNHCIYASSHVITAHSNAVAFFYLFVDKSALILQISQLAMVLFNFHIITLTAIDVPSAIDS